jgi:hypothetical protein
MPAAKRSGVRRATRPTVTRKLPKRASAQIPGEKAVRQTSKTVPVAPPKKKSAAEKKISPRAIDRRKHFPEADAPRGGPKVRPGSAAGGSARSAPPVPLS